MLASEKAPSCKYILPGAGGVLVNVLATTLGLLADALALFGTRGGAADEAVVADDCGKVAVPLTRIAHDADAGGAVMASGAVVWLSLAGSV